MNWEFNAKQYESASSHQREWGRTLIAELNLRGNEHVLDLGCGDGTLTRRISECVPGGNVLGIDASRSMIDTATEKTTENLRFLQMDIRDLDFDSEFDIVFSNAVLHWIMDHDDLLRRVYRALRSGGSARFNFAGNGNCVNFFHVVQNIMAHEPFARYFMDFKWPWYMPTVDEYTALAGSSLFEKIVVWGENADRFFPDADSMIRWIDQPSLVPLLPVLPDELRRPFRDAVVTGMIEQTIQDDGRCFETFRRINLHATK